MNNQFQKHNPGHYIQEEANGSRPQPSIETGRRSDHPNLDFISIDNRENEYRDALKHSKKVKFWKIAFPVIGIIVIAGIAGAMFMSSVNTPEIAIDDITLDDGKLVMENPQLNGIDKNRRPYNLTAAKAIQDTSNPNRVELQQISAELPMDEKYTATIKAGNGVYDADARTLKLKETVNVVTSSGMIVNLQDADVDIGNSSMKTNNPISASSPQADIASNTLSIEDGGNKMVFEGRVRMTLRPDKLRQASETNAQN